jgi:hypothetical protein
MVLTPVGILVVKRVEYGVLKIHIHRLKISSIRQRLAFCGSASTANWRTIFICKDNCSRKLSKSLAHFFSVLGQGEWDCGLQQYGSSTISLLRK